MRGLRIILLFALAMGVRAASLTPFKPSMRTVVSGGGGGSSPTYVLWENWEGSPVGWSKQNNAALVFLNNTTNKIAESQSLYAAGDTGSSNPPYAYRTAPFGEMADCYVFFLYKPTVGPSADDFVREIGWLADYPANGHLVEMDLHRITSSDYRIRVFAGTTGSVAPSAGFALGSTNAIWLRYQKGTGANARVDVWWADASAGPPYIKPADGTSHHAHRDDGDYTTSVEQIQLGAIFRSGQGNEGAYDWVIVSSTAIGDVSTIPATYTTSHESNASAIASTLSVGRQSTNYYAGQTGWDPGANISIGHVAVQVTAVGTIEGNNYTCEIWSLSGNDLNTKLGSSIVHKGNSGWSSSDVQFLFTTPVSVSSGTQYAIVLTTNAAADASNYLDIHFTGSGGFGGQLGYFDSSKVRQGTSTSDMKATVYK